MAIENFTNFAVSLGFFIGAFFGILKFDSVIEILMVTFLISMVMFLIICACGVFIIRYLELKEEEHLEKSVYETILEEYRVRVNRKQNEFNKITSVIRSLNIKDVLIKDREERKRQEKAELEQKSKEQ